MEVVMTLVEACDRAVKEGSARRVFGSAIEIIKPIDQEKFRQFEENYAVAVNLRVQKRRRSEIEAWKKLQRDGPWYF
ncbi:MAG: hypothetical protein ABIA08_00210 [bacterium]